MENQNTKKLDKKEIVLERIQNEAKFYDIELADGSMAKIIDVFNMKALKSEKYNFLFNRVNGMFVRFGGTDLELPTGFKPTIDEVNLFNTWKSLWGKKAGTFKEFCRSLQGDGDPSVGLPEIADWELSTKCRGVKCEGDKMASPCLFCYKSNIIKGENINFEDFKTTFNKLPRSIGQIAFGIGSIDQIPELWDMCKYVRSEGVIPNCTINAGDMTPDLYDKCAEHFGAIAVSVYDKELTYNAIKELTDRGMTQVNIHFMIASETFDKAMGILDDIKNDSRLAKLKAIVFLKLKPVGNASKGENFTKISQEDYRKMITKANDLGISIGSDTCGAFSVLDAYKDTENYDKIIECVETCESSIYSVYINYKNYMFPCSFSEKSVSYKYPELDWRDEGLSVLECDDFLKDVWQHPRTQAFRKQNLKCVGDCESCSMYDV